MKIYEEDSSEIKHFIMFGKNFNLIEININRFQYERLF